MDFITMKREFRRGLVCPITIRVKGPTENQIQKWEYDGGHYQEADHAELIDGNLYLHLTEKLKARLANIQNTFRARSFTQQQNEFTKRRTL